MELTLRREQAGFTLLEVLIAMVILGVGILSIGLAQISSVKVASKSRSLSQAMYLTGDTLGDAGIQPCPICNLGTCFGGPNNAMACTAGADP